MRPLILLVALALAGRRPLTCAWTQRPRHLAPPRLVQPHAAGRRWRASPLRVAPPTLSDAVGGGAGGATNAPPPRPPPRLSLADAIDGEDGAARGGGGDGAAVDDEDGSALLEELEVRALVGRAPRG